MFFTTLRRLTFQKILRSAACVWTPSSFTKNILTNMDETHTQTSKLRNKTHVIHCGVDFQRFQKPNIKKNSRPSLITIGHIKPRKGIHFVLEALGEIKKENIDFQYTIVGPRLDKTYEKHLKTIIKQHNIQSNVSFISPLKGDDLVETLGKHHIYVQPSSAFAWNFEGFGIVFLEANAMGIPAIAPNFSGITSAVYNKENGLVVEDGNIGMLKDAIMSLLTDKTLYDAISQRSVEWAKTHDWSIIAKQHITLYEEVIK